MPAGSSSDNHLQHWFTLSILKTKKGFLTNAILASVFRARNSCTSSLFAISGMAHNCCEERCSFSSFLRQLPSLITKRRWNRVVVLYCQHRDILSATCQPKGPHKQVPHLQERF